MKADDDKLISKLLDETYNKTTHVDRNTVSNVVNLSDYFNRRETFYKEKSKGNNVSEFQFYFKDFGSFRRLIFGELKLDIPKGMGLLSIDPSYGEEIVLKITDETFKNVISKTLAREVSHLWLKSGNTGQFLGRGDRVDGFKKVA